LTIDILCLWVFPGQSIRGYCHWCESSD